MILAWFMFVLVVVALAGGLWRVLGRKDAPVPDIHPIITDALSTNDLTGVLGVDFIADRPPSPKAEDYLLSRFRTLERVNDYTSANQLDRRLGRSRWAVFDEFDREGLTRLATPTEVLNQDHTLDSLKTMCRTEGLKVGGKKSEVIGRLLAANPLRVSLEQCSAYRILTEVGVARMERYFCEEERDWNLAATGIISALEEGDLSAAVDLAERYNEMAVYPVMAFRGAYARDFIARMWTTSGESFATRAHAVLSGTIGIDYPGKWWIDKQAQKPDGLTLHQG